VLRNRMMRGAGYSRLQSPLLLDTYGGAAAAYSLRKLRTAYAGAAIRVRRSSDSAEQDFGFLNDVLDTAAMLSWVNQLGTAEGFVTTWYDQSGNARNATQATATNQPRIVASGVVEDGIRFDGNNDMLTVAPSVSLNSNPMTVCGRVMVVNATLFDVLWTRASSPSWKDGFGLYVEAGSKVRSWNHWYSQAGRFRDVAYTANTWTTFAQVANSTNWSTYKDGSLHGTDTVGADYTKNASTNSLSIGGYEPTYFGIVRISDLIIWSSDQSASMSAIHTAITP